jgi:mRNA interferase RelE/StbE
MRKLDLTRDAWKFLRGLEPKQYKQVVHKLLSLMDDPTPYDSQALRGSDKRRADVGEYRIVYSLDAECVYVAVVGKRNDDEVYRDLKRRC